MYNPMGLYKNFLPAIGVIRQGVIDENFHNAFSCTKRCPWAIRGQKPRKIAKKIIFLQPKMGGLYTRGLYIRHYSSLLISPLIDLEFKSSYKFFLSAGDASELCSAHSLALTDWSTRKTSVPYGTLCIPYETLSFQSIMAYPIPI